ncbi:retrovirus-related pol polyprotein from transposon TNT 1-94 [Tanacetum coccineum]
MAKATQTQTWLCHRKLSHLNFDTINLLSKNDIVNGLPKLKYVKDQLCSSCKLGKANRSSFKTKYVSSSKGELYLFHMDLCGPMRIESINGKRSKGELYLFHMDLCGPMRIESINGKKYILVIVDDYSRYTWTLFMRSKGTEFLNKTLQTYFKEEGIDHQIIIAQTPEQNGVVERRNHTLVKAARTMLSASKLLLFFWAESPTAELIGVDFGRISIRHCEILKSISLNVLARSQR